MRQGTIRSVLFIWQVLDKLRTPARVSSKRSKLIAQLNNFDFAKAATHAAIYRRNARPKFEYHPDLALFSLVDDDVHYFAHRERLKYYLSGRKERGRQLAHEYLLERIQFEDGDRVVDIGANVGDLTLAFEHLNCRMEITAFEPSPREFQALKKNLQCNRSVISFLAHNAAAWETADEAMTFYLKSDTADSSLIPIESFNERIHVPTVRLEDVLPRQDYKLLKLEAEGAEPEILKGAMGILDCFEYIAADVGFERGLKQDSTLPPVTNLLFQHGFEIVAVGKERLVILFKRRST